MRKSTAASLVLIIILIGVGYTFFWFKKADEFKASLQDFLTRQNELAKGLSKDTIFIRYESISASGYPFAIRLNIIKPVIDIPLSAMMQDYREKKNPQAPVPDNIVFELSYDDIISVSSNLFADRFSLEVSGNSSMKPIVNNEAREALITNANTPLLCHLGIYNPDSQPWNVPQSFSDQNAFFTALRSVDCTISSATYTQSGTPAATIENVNLTLVTDPIDSTNRKITFDADVKNGKSLPAVDETLNSWLQLLFDAKGIAKNQRGEPLNFSQYGTQNSTIRLSYEGPTEVAALTDPAAQVSLDVGAFNSQNDLYDVKSKAHFITGIHGDERTASLVVHSSLQATEQYEQMLAKAVSKVLNAASANPAMGANFAREINRSGNVDAVAAAIVPKLHTIGEIHFDTDIETKGDKDKNILENGDVTVNQLDLTTSAYGLKVKGGGKTTSSNLPVGALMVTCVLCDAMMDTIGDYAITVDSLLAKNRAGQTTYVTKPLVDGIKQFFHAIDSNTDKNSKDIAVHVVVDDQGKITISGKQLLEVIGLFGVNAGQSLQHLPAKAQ